MRPGILPCVLATVGLAACGDSPRPAPSPNPSDGSTIRGTERIGWDQGASNVAELNTLRYAIYVDGNRSVLADVICANSAGAVGFACSGRLPGMSPGAHTLELAAFLLSGDTLVESARSAPFPVIVSPGVVPPAIAPSGSREGPAPEPPSTGQGSGERFALVPVVQGFSDITDVSVVPDDRLLIAERAGVVHVVDLTDHHARTALVLNDSVANGGMGVLLSIVADPAYDRTHMLYVLRTIQGRDGDASFQIARYRGAGDILGERAVLLESGRVDPSRPAGTIRIGTDGKLYAAVFESARQSMRGELRTTILRINPDGTTPSDQLSGSPVFAAGEREPRGLDWHPASGQLWLAQDGGDGTPRIVEVPRDRRRARTGLAETDRPLPRAGRVSAIRFYNGELIPALRGTLLVASENGLHSVHFDPQDGSRITSIERVMQIPARGISIAPDGRLFVASADAVFQVQVR